MMTITNYIAPRQCGKSTFALMLYLANPEKNLLMFHSASTVKTFTDKLSNQEYNKDRILYQSQFDKIKDCEILIIDEYLFYSKKHKQEILDRICKYNINTITISTADRVYNKPIFDLVKKYYIFDADSILKYLHNECQYLPNLDEYTLDFINNELEYLEYNLLIYSVSKNVTVDWIFRKDHETILKVLNDVEQYNLEFKNQWIFNNNNK